MTRDDLRREARDRAEATSSAPVAELTVPLLIGTLLTSAIAAYLVGPWALIWVGIELALMLMLAIRRPEMREAAAAGALGACVGGLGVLGLGLLGLIGTGHR